MAFFDFNKAFEEISSEINAIQFSREPKELYDPVTYFLGLGGKKMRPLLVLLGSYLYDDDYRRAIKPSLAVELFHNFTLIHDDIMDNAPLRRGQKTVHEKWNQNIALLAGDVTLIEAYELLAFVPAQIRDDIYKKFNLTARQVCEGQQFDMNFEQQGEVSITSYIEMIKLKTAVLLGFSMYLGARLGGAEMEDAEKLYNAALNLGISFQIKDDYLDVFGHQEKVGKLVGGDIIANKKTYLLLNAFQLADAADKKNLHDLLHNPQNTKEEKVKKVTLLYEKLGVRQQTEIAMNQYFQQSLLLLDQLAASPEKKEFLKKYFTDLKDRES